MEEWPLVEKWLPDGRSFIHTRPSRGRSAKACWSYLCLIAKSFQGRRDDGLSHMRQIFFILFCKIRHVQFELFTETNNTIPKIDTVESYPWQDVRFRRCFILQGQCFFCCAEKRQTSIQVTHYHHLLVQTGITGPGMQSAHRQLHQYRHF